MSVPTIDLLSTNSAATGRQIAIDMFMELKDGENPTEVVMRYSKKLSSEFRDDPKTVRSFAAGFLDMLIVLMQ